MKFAAENVGVTDVRHLSKDDPPLLEQLASFRLAAQQFNADKGLKINFVLGKLNENEKKLHELLDKPWNTELRDVSVAVSQDAGTSKGDAEDYLFKLATPLKQKASFTCTQHNCDFTVSNHVVFKRHLKAKHGIITKVDAPRVTCMLPHQQRGTRVIDRHTMDQICSHLSQVGILA